MAEELHVWGGSAYRQATEVHVWDGSQYRQCSEVHVWNGSAWKQVFSTTGTVTLTDRTIPPSSPASIAGIRINADGTVDRREGGTYTQVSASTNWIIPNSAASSDYDVRITNAQNLSIYPFPGWYVQAASTGTWINLGSNREWSVLENRSGNYTRVRFDLEIRDGTGTTVATATITLSADYGY